MRRDVPKMHVQHARTAARKAAREAQLLFQEWVSIRQECTPASQENWTQASRIYIAYFPSDDQSVSNTGCPLRTTVG